MGFEANKSKSSPAYFLSLKVANVACFGPEQTLDLSDGEGRPAQWTLILGEDGSGKTTLLRLLAYMDVGGFRDAFEKDSMHINIQLQMGESQREFVYPFNQEIASGIQGLFVCYGYGVSRRQTSNLSSIDNESFPNTKSLFTEGSWLNNPEELILRLDAAAGKEGVDGVYSTRLSQVKDLFMGVLPDIHDLKIVGSNTGSSLHVEAETPYGWVKFSQLSQGYQAMVTWIADFAQRMFDRYPESKDPLKEPAIVLIDEIDLHMHPKWQRKILSYLSGRFSNTQFVVTANSPVIVQSAPEKSNVIILKHNKGHVLIEKSPANIQNWRIDQLLTGELFGLESARSPEVAKLMKERLTLVRKGERTDAEETKLFELEQYIQELPGGETPEQMKAMDLIEEVASILSQRTEK